MIQKTLYLFFLLIAFKHSFSNVLIQKKFLKQKDIDKVFFFKNLSSTQKNEDLDFFDLEFNHLKNKYIDKPEIQKYFIYSTGLIKQLNNKHLDAIIIFSDLLENEKYLKNNQDFMDFYISIQESYLELNLFSKVFEINKEIEKLIKKGTTYPLWSYNRQSRLFFKLKEYDKAIKTLKKEINVLLKNPKRDSLIVPSAYNDLGFYYYLKNDFTNALTFFEKSLTEGEKSLKKNDSLNFKAHYINSKGNIAATKIQLEKFEDVITIITNEILPFVEKNNFHEIISLKILLCEAYLGKNNFNEVTKIFSEIEKICCNDSPKLKLNFLHIKSLFYKKTGDYKNASLISDKINIIKDSINLNLQKVLLKSSELNYYIDEKEKEIITKNEIIKQNDKAILSLTILGLIFIVIISILIIASNKIKRDEIEKMNVSISQKNLTIENSLKEKEILLKEIHHRVKNNLQIISGILNIQNNKITDPKAKEILSEGRDRIQAIALLHKAMYQNDSFKFVNIKEYITELINYVKKTTLHSKNNIEIAIAIEDQVFSIETALPLSLIINECINNSFKHAFNDQNNGSISIVLKKMKPDSFSLIINDNGVGFPENLKNNEFKKNTGFELIQGLVQQLDGELIITNQSGAKIEILFNETS